MGMNYWKILVLGTLRLAYNFVYDKLNELADNHSTLRQMLGHGILDFDSHYPLQTLKHNASLLATDDWTTSTVLLSNSSKSLKAKTKEDTFLARCDSFVVETNVHYPTDISLLLEAMRKVITLMSLVCSEENLSDWCQSEPNKRKLKKAYRKAQQLKRFASQDPKKRAQREQTI